MSVLNILTFLLQIHGGLLTVSLQAQCSRWPWQVLLLLWERPVVWSSTTPRRVLVRNTSCSLRCFYQVILMWPPQCWVTLTCNMCMASRLAWWTCRWARIASCFLTEEPKWLESVCIRWIWTILLVTGKVRNAGVACIPEIPRLIMVLQDGTCSISVNEFLWICICIWYVIYYYGIKSWLSCYHTCQVTLDISGSPIKFQWGSWKYPG